MNRLSIAKSSLLVAFLIAASTLGAGSALAQKTMSISSPSMEPTLRKGESVHIDLLAYAYLAPVRWDVIAYLSPANEYVYIHRVVGLPGDTIVYDKSKRLRINDAMVELTPANVDTPDASAVHVLVESFGEERHLIQVQSKFPAVFTKMLVPFPQFELCEFSESGFRCTVPEGHFFVMGDNRDNSQDSRYVGFISERRVWGRVGSLRRVAATREPVPNPSIERTATSSLRELAPAAHVER